MKAPWRIATAAGGIVFVLLAAIGNDVLSNAGDAPAADASAREIGAYVTANPPTTPDWAGMYLEILGLLALAAFVVHLWGVLRSADADGRWSMLALLGGAAAVTVKLASAAPVFAVWVRADEGIEPQLATALLDMNTASFALTGAALALMLAGVAGAVGTTGVLPRWLGATAGVLALALLATLPLAATGFSPAFLLLLLWISGASAVLVRRAIGEPGQRTREAVAARCA